MTSRTVLDTAIPAKDKVIVSLTVDTIGGELRELTERYPDRKDTSVSGGQSERMLARSALKELVLTLRRIDIAANEDRFNDAAAEYKNYRYLMVAAIPSLLVRSSAVVTVQSVSARRSLRAHFRQVFFRQSSLRTEKNLYRQPADISHSDGIGRTLQRINLKIVSTMCPLIIATTALRRAASPRHAQHEMRKQQT